jgi:hypothetical protein
MSARKKQKTKSTPAARSALVDIISILSDCSHTHFDGVFPRLVALGCKELADLVFGGRLKLRGIMIHSPGCGDLDGSRLAEIRAGYERYRTWYPNLYTVVGVTATSPHTMRGLDKFYAFYDQVIFDHAATIKKLAIEVSDLQIDPRHDVQSLIVHSFLDSVRMCSETTHLTMSIKHVTSKRTTRRAESVIEYMYNLEHLSFTGIPYEPHLVHPPNPETNKHFLYLLPPTLVSLRIACRRMSYAMAVHNERAMQYLFEKDKLPSLTTVDLSDYHMPMTPPRDAPSFMMQLAHPNSRVSCVFLPKDAEATYYSSLCLKKMLNQGYYLSRRRRQPFKVVVVDEAPRVRAARVASIVRTIRDHEIENVLVESAPTSGTEQV